MLNYVFQSWLNGYKKIFCFSGREGRSAFGSFLFLQFFVMILLAMICYRVLYAVPGFGNGMISQTIMIIYLIISLLTTLSYNVRRLHDANIPAWICIFYIGLFAFVIAISLLVATSPKTNKYGEPAPSMPIN